MKPPRGPESSSSLRDRPSAPDALLLQAFTRLDKTALGVAVGAICALTVWGATTLLVAKGGREVGPTLALLGQYFVGYTVGQVLPTSIGGDASRIFETSRRHPGQGGPIAGTAEEVFFRGYMQSRLRQRWPPSASILATSAAFALLHFDWLHGVLACALGIYLGLCTEATGSALPAVTGHVVNNSLFTLLTALVGPVPGFEANLVLLTGAGLIFVGCVAWIVRLKK